MRHISDAERRARLMQRHALSPGHRTADPEAATRAVTVLHSTEPATVYLSVWARVDAVTVADVDRALYVERSLVKQLAMRRTLFVFPRDLLPAAWGSASARVAEQLEARLVKEVEAAGHATDGAAWLDEARTRVVEVLSGGRALTAQEIRKEVPALEARLDLSPGKKYAANVSMGPRVLTQLAVEGTVVRGENAGHWRLSKPRWALMSDWLGEVPPPAKADEGYAELVGRWLRAFGPGTEADLVWWLGATKGAVRAALSALEAVEVSLDGGGTGWVLPEDLDEVASEGPSAALLPVLDPTVMGWKERGFYLGGHGPQLFDRNGNAGTTAWWDGRVVGCWVQDDHGVVEVRLLERLPAAATRALAVEAERLTGWLDGVRIGTVYPSTAMKVVEWVHI
ncbi:MAG TPA: winged helix DNA-binding domain-containing protein [Nocardioides sp.]|uniref:winged helix DNA-binding domain-containing protein n=1 Tax=Nocardioides sp. TaxID=35761 RepID=UPI002E36879B|nr:winged helix DNA-binding domain-containing protein [Nocardioides sp.]HEX5090609.1 winged helix DNA-binding domain-containing protein [Nocardioides sp.]